MLPLVEFGPIRDIYGVAFRDTFRDIFPRARCRSSPCGFPGGIGFARSDQGNAIHWPGQRDGCRPINQAENEGPDDWGRNHQPQEIDAVWPVLA
ncbi:hypothetical protein VH88_11690 [Brevundimonas sp. KM4]|nr:hypothetical protein VH88_11690 [Brevundimonas sp. KM4]